MELPSLWNMWVQAECLLMANAGKRWVKDQLFLRHSGQLSRAPAGYLHTPDSCPGHLHHPWQLSRAPAPLLTAVQGTCSTPDSCPGHMRGICATPDSCSGHLHHSWQLFGAPAPHPPRQFHQVNWSTDLLELNYTTARPEPIKTNKISMNAFPKNIS